MQNVLGISSGTTDARVSALEMLLVAEREQVAKLTVERDLLRAAHERLRLELELLKRRIFAAKAERVDTAQLELEFAQRLAELDQLAGVPAPVAPPAQPEGGGDGASKPAKHKPTGRRDLRKAALEEERLELSDPLLEQLVLEGKATRIGFEESCKLAWRRGGMRRLVVARVKYAVIDQAGESAVETTPMPPESF